jgi:predicted ATPase
VFFVDLSTATGSDAVVALIAGAIGLGDSPERSPIDELKARLRPLRLLLVLDNFEQVTAAAATLVELLEHGPGLTLLVTSREALRVRGEHLLNVPPMALPAATGGPTSAAELGGFEAIQLFVARARAANPAFNLTDDNAAAVAEICRRLDGLPLAIELATARLNLFSPDALLGRLESRLAVLRGGARDLPLRQQTMRATIEWSYQLLDPPEQRLFELLSVFAGATTDIVEAVAARVGPVAGADLDVVEGLGSLLDKSLVRQAEGGASDEPRIVMLETIREYASERLAAQPELAVAAREAHAVAFAELAARATAADPGTEGPGAVAERLADELDNLRAAWRHWVGARDLVRLEQLEDALWAGYEARGWYHATIELIRDHLDVLADSPATPERWEEEVTLRTSLGRALTLLRGYTGEAEDAYLAALALFEDRPEGERRRLFPVLRGLSSFYGFRGEFDRGIAIIGEMLRLADEQGDASMRLDGTILLGGYTCFQGRLEEGIALLEQANAEAAAGGYRMRRLRLGNDLRVTGLTTVGFALWLLGKPDQALDRADRAIALARSLDHPYSLAYALYHVGFLHLWRREPERMRDRALEVLRLAETNDLPLWRALGRCLLGSATSSLGDPQAGLDHIAAGLDLYGGLRTPPVFWPLVRYLEAGARLEAGDPLHGLPLVDEALALAGDEDILSPLFGILRGDLLLAVDPPDVDGARASYDGAARVAAKLGTQGSLLRVEARRIRVARPEERDDRAAALRAVLASFEEGRSAPDALDAERLLAGA